MSALYAVSRETRTFAFSTRIFGAAIDMIKMICHHYHMENKKFETLLKKHAAVIERTRRELAMNFDIPARSIIQWACADMGISEKTWREMESYSMGAAA
jgi:hypothetical protein